MSPQSYLQLRENTQARDRSLREKVMSLEDAAALVNNGEHIALGGCTMSRTPMAMVWALIRAGKKDLMMSRSIVSNEGDLLYASGACNHILTSWFSQGIVWGVSKVMRLYTEQEAGAFRGVESHVHRSPLPGRRYGCAVHTVAFDDGFRCCRAARRVFIRWNARTPARN